MNQKSANKMSATAAAKQQRSKSRRGTRGGTAPAYSGTVSVLQNSRGQSPGGVLEAV
jgi:hypothetical protein